METFQKNARQFFLLKRDQALKRKQEALASQDKSKGPLGNGASQTDFQKIQGVLAKD